MTNRTATAQAPGYCKFKLGDFTVVAAHEGVVSRDRPAGFVRNAADEDVGTAFATIGLPRDKLTITFTALAVDTGKGVVLIDTGFGQSGPPTTGKLLGNLEAAGIAASDVGTVILSHFHGDHISGLRDRDGNPTFPNAEIVVPAPEWAFWTDESRAASAPENLKGNFALVGKLLTPSAADIRRFEWDAEIVPGFHAVRADGHTPGHTAIAIESAGERMLYAADITNNPAIFARHPEWQAAFDIDADEAVRTRRRLLDMAAAENLRLSFYHAAFPATGYIAKNASGYEFIPALWRQDL